MFGIKTESPGYSNSCKGYDEGVFITNEDIAAILRRINEKRSFVASGLGKNKLLPHAANMRKIVWSDELAKSAQRWVDQCDPRPNAEDECRNLGAVKVGQCVASISGATSGLNVKSFIDSWFMTSMIYTGTISYYNQTSDYNSRQFTQLIWAITSEVGCGRAKFIININEGSKFIDRLVCNFAPSGNVQGEIVYAIGFPATQCPVGTAPDAQYLALCASINMHIATPATSTPRNTLSALFNASKEVRTLREYIGFKELPKNETNGRNQRIRHIPYNETSDYATMHTTLEFWKDENMGKKITKEPQFTKISHLNTREHARRCTRRMRLSNNSIKVYNPPKKCTRKFKSPDHHTVPTILVTHRTNNHHTTNRKCTRNFKTTCTCDIPLHLEENYPIECDHDPPDYQYNYSDLNKRWKYFPIVFNNPSMVVQKDPLINPPLPIPINQHMDHVPHIPDYIQNDYVYTNYKEPQRYYFTLDNNYKLISPLFNLNTRTKRQFNQHNANKLWQNVYSVTERPLHLKSLRYTTNSRKKNRKLSTTLKSPMITTLSTESITLKPDYELQSENPRPKIPEKFLSFDELMTLRRKNDMINFDDGRRTNANSLRQEQSSTEATLYSRIRHCTRKLTCTWTRPTLKNETSQGRGSRTPPGYVEGCTRTSTCTREHLDKNKYPDSGIGSEEGSGHDYDDYCEKRALHVQRRNLGVDKRKLRRKDTTRPMVPESSTPKIIRKQFLRARQKSEHQDYSDDCIC